MLSCSFTLCVWITNSCLVTGHALAADLTPQSTIDSIESVLIGSIMNFNVSYLWWKLCFGSKKHCWKHICGKKYHIRKLGGGGGGGGQAGLRRNKSECWSLFHLPPPPWSVFVQIKSSIRPFAEFLSGFSIWHEKSLSIFIQTCTLSLWTVNCSYYSSSCVILPFLLPLFPATMRAFVAAMILESHCWVHWMQHSPLGRFRVSCCQDWL